MTRLAVGLVVLGLFTGCAAPSPPATAAASRGESAGQTLLQQLRTRFPAEDRPASHDTRLRLTFKTKVKLGSAGKIQIFEVNGPAEPAVGIDLAEGDYSELVGGRLFHTVLPIFIDDDMVTIAPAGGALVANRSYYVTIDDGVFLAEDGASLGSISDPVGFRFQTRVPSPARPDRLTVGLDGQGDFGSVQGALDFVPTGNDSPVVITLAPGIYHEILLLSGKNKITLVGDSRETTFLAYPNNDNLQQKLGSKYRAMVSVEYASDIVFERLTLHNLTSQQPPGGVGYQAEALRVDPGQRVVLRNSSFISRQDTLQLTGSVYIVDSYVEGNVDYVWGKGVSYFERSELKTVGRPGYLVQSRNAPGTYGTVFVDSRLSIEPEAAGTYFARIDGALYPGSAVALVDCTLGPHFAPAGFLVTATTSFDALRFLEYRSKALDGSLVDISQRSPASRQLSANEALALRDRAAVLGWDPRELAKPQR